MKYTAKDVCKIYHVNRETLRYYERIGLIRPEIDESNRYRYYDDWSLNFIGECRKYRSMGLSIKDISEILEKDSLQDFTKRLELQQKEIQKQLTFYTKWSKRNEEYIQSLKRLTSLSQCCELSESEPTYFIPFRQKYDQIMNEPTLEAMKALMEHHTFVDSVLYIPSKDFQNYTENFYWGHAICEKWLNDLDIPTDKMMFFPKKQCICTAINAGERWGMNYHLFDHVRQYMSDHQYILDGDIFGNLLTRVHENGNYCRYLEMYFPVKTR